MDFFITSILFLFLLILIFLKCYTYIKNAYSFWKVRKIPYVEPQFPFGNISEATTNQKHFGIIMKNFYNKWKNHGDFIGLYFFMKPAVFALSPDFIKIVLVKDFQYLMDHGTYINEEADPLSGNLFFLEGEKWRNLRHKITPTFSSHKLKNMFLIIKEIAERVVVYIDPLVSKNGKIINIGDILERLTSDTIASCAFGIECNSIFDPNEQFFQISRKLFNFSQLERLKTFMLYMFKRESKKLGLKMFNSSITKYFMKIIKEVIHNRQSTGIVRNDFLNLLLQLHNKGKLDDEMETVGKLSFTEMAAQCFIFIVGGYETTSATLKFALHLLALNHDKQKLLRDEINEILKKYDSNLNYDALNEMTYLHRVILETLRIYPSCATLHRVTTKEYTLPNGATIPENTQIVIPLLGIHHDEKYYPEPMKFEPDRFTDENISSRHPYTYLPFGEGPRICIGKRFAMLEIKLFIAILIKNFKFEVCEKTRIPVEINPVGLTYNSKDEIWLNVIKI